MGEPFIGSEAVATRRITPYQLRSRFVCVYPNVYVPTGTELTAAMRARAAWLWTRRRGVVAGQSAAALHGTKWVDACGPAEMLYDNRHVPRGLRSWSDRFADDEIVTVRGVPTTSPARTALDIACRRPVDRAVAEIDALARATHLKVADVELLVERYPGRRGMKAAREALALADAGAESPRETWLRLLVIRAGFPPPQTQLKIYDDRYGVLVGEVDMGWEAVKVALDYEGEHHRMTRRVFNKDIRRSELITELGWIHVRVTVEDTPAVIVRRLQAAWDRRV
ncbi:type IV toxin-antitoxin system AbiEi family antitoxin [Mycolicibacterium sp. F2034L]|uniref:type IV toxin-antitoxin system AbiEi family antitoxin n=1 Tax=Mycolicibacterium sp. F2034L TaxID=2926422 RepID=UPI001FF6F05A|nr:type IV toxin-antitoxin system AbiEi family antitoxin [Mycolicibacterium sp. F2034L]MCK0176776.1 type IV toxin-antitoxin system AbiEi family antitoxin [Mycolicibacterium sp. F2034L]